MNNFKAVKEALEHLASIHLIELCNEAIIERCRRCGVDVQHVLNSCQHTSLCDTCSQKCDLCPICKTPLLNQSERHRPRLYYECVEAGLITEKHDPIFEGILREKGQTTVDVQRLYSLFNVALENNMVSLICHYITNVCMDNNAVSSDPILAFLLDEVVVRDWCQLTFQRTVNELQTIYNMENEKMKSMLTFLLKLLPRLSGISVVLEVLEMSFKCKLSSQFGDFRTLQENILKSKQHLEIMIWCIRHEFLSSVPSCYQYLDWCSVVRERKSSTLKRKWPSVNRFMELSNHEGSLFIEDALSNIFTEEGYSEKKPLFILPKDCDISGFLSNGDGMMSYYPFKNVRVAAYVLFLNGSSDTVIAKQAIFLYYLFDRHHANVPIDQWKPVVNDFASTFVISRHSFWESLIFYLLDDDTDVAFQEACQVLPLISSQEIHPKIAQVLLERQNSDGTLMLLRWSGKCGDCSASLNDAVTGVRVRVESGLLTEAFMYQRMTCMEFVKSKGEMKTSGTNLDEWTCSDWIEVLVTEICCLCIRRNLVDRMLELPWDVEEEKYLHNCLMDFAIDNPLSNVGSLLVVFYLQRYRYADAYRVDHKLQNVEKNFIFNNGDNKISSTVESICQWRSLLVEKSTQMLSEIEMRLLKADNSTSGGSSMYNEVDGASLSKYNNVHNSIRHTLTNILPPPSENSSLIVHSPTPNGFGKPSKSSGFLNNCWESVSPELHQKMVFGSTQKAGKYSMSVSVDDIKKHSRGFYDMSDGGMAQGLEMKSPYN